jgi:hypothetical protein
MVGAKDDGGAILRVPLVAAGASVAVGLVALVADGAGSLGRAAGVAAVAAGALLALATVPLYSLREAARVARADASAGAPRPAPALVKCRTCGVTDVRYRFRCWNCGHRL